MTVWIALVIVCCVELILHWYKKPIDPSRKISDIALFHFYRVMCHGTHDDEYTQLQHAISAIPGSNFALNSEGSCWSIQLVRNFTHNIEKDGLTTEQRDFIIKEVDEKLALIYQQTHPGA